jgi:hypothetical protein
MMLEIQVLAWNRHTNVAGLNQIMYSISVVLIKISKNNIVKIQIGRKTVKDHSRPSGWVV